MDFEMTDQIAEEDRQQIHNALYQYNLSKLEDKNPRSLGVYHRVNGEIKAGVIAVTHGNWLDIDLLFVSEELRGSGIGSKLLLAAEQEAIKRGCKYSFLYTYDFQGPKFYPKFGYREVFVMENYPHTGKRHYFVKELV